MQLLKLIWALFFVKVEQGQTIPRFYGIAWSARGRDHAWAMPIPLNLVAAYLRAAWLWAKCEAWRVADR